MQKDSSQYNNSLTLRMERELFSQTVVSYHITKQRHNREARDLILHRREYFQSHNSVSYH
jgi:hypothetical protein